MEHLAHALHFEASGQAHMRGITDDDPEMQTFEIFIPPDLMRHYR